MINKLNYKIESGVYNYKCPIYRGLIDNKELNYFLIPAGLEFSYKNEGVIPILNCNCGIVGCGGAYINVKHYENNIVWDSAYPEYYEFDLSNPDAKELNKKVHKLKLIDKKFIKLPLVFDRKDYKKIIIKLIKDLNQVKYEKEQYLRDVEKFSNGFYFYS